MTGEQKLIDHQRYCLSKEPLRLDPSPETTIHFKNAERSQPVRFVIYADFECALEPTTNSSESITLYHVPHSYGFLVKDSLNDTQVIRRYRGPNAGQHFVDSLKTEELSRRDTLYHDRQMDPKLSADKQVAYDSATTCFICSKTFTDPDQRYVIICTPPHSHSEVLPITHVTLDTMNKTP